MKQHEHSSLAERLACPSCLRSTAPAADAGPRQCGKFMTRVNNSWDMLCNAASGHEPPCSFTMPISMPPVPQEAAPTKLTCGCECECNCGFCVHCRTHKATAPDSAMRVAREVIKYVESTGDNGAIMDEQVAKVIRQAGSEREREIAKTLAEIGKHLYSPSGTAISGYSKLKCNECHREGIVFPKTGLSLEHISTCAIGRASRLLGGESK